MIIGLRRKHKLEVLLRVAGLARSTFYYQRQSLQLADKHSNTKTHICAEYNEHKGRYGSQADCHGAFQINGAARHHKCVQRLMQQKRLR